MLFENATISIIYVNPPRQRHACVGPSRGADCAIRTAQRIMWCEVAITTICSLIVANINCVFREEFRRIHIEDGRLYAGTDISQPREAFYYALRTLPGRRR
jgi:uncharacterized membrane protein YagU involved in acid resistance